MVRYERRVRGGRFTVAGRILLWDYTLKGMLIRPDREDPDDPDDPDDAILAALRITLQTQTALVRTLTVERRQTWAQYHQTQQDVTASRRRRAAALAVHTWVRTALTAAKGARARAQRALQQALRDRAH